MIFLTYVLLCLVLSFLVIVSLLFLAFTLDSLIRGHYLPTSRQATKTLAAILQKHKPGAQIFYDLGCAHGTLSLRLKKTLPCIDIYGIDNSAVRIFFANLKNKILGRRVNFQKKDIFKTDLSSADIIYAYLWYDLMPILKKKLQKELKQGAIVITNTSHFQGWKPIEKVIIYPKISKTPHFETLFIYVKK